MPDRLQELLQQRALIKEHLAWLEAEIAAASGKPLPSSPSASSSPASPSSPSLTSTLGQKTSPQTVRVEIADKAALIYTPKPPQQREDAEADALLHKLAAEDRPPPPPSKTGCWVIFSTVLLVLVIATWAVLRHFYPKTATPVSDEQRTEVIVSPSKPAPAR